MSVTRRPPNQYKPCPQDAQTPVNDTTQANIDSHYTQVRESMVERGHYQAVSYAEVEKARINGRDYQDAARAYCF